MLFNADSTCDIDIPESTKAKRNCLGVIFCGTESFCAAISISSFVGCVPNLDSSHSVIPQTVCSRLCSFVNSFAFSGLEIMPKE